MNTTKKLCAVTGAVMILTLVSATDAHASGNDNQDGNKKVFVCKYVGKPHVDERLQTGQNPISVSVNSIPIDPVVPGSEFADKQGRSVVIAFDLGQPEPSVSDCPAPSPPLVPETPVIPAEVKFTDPVCGSDGYFTVPTVEGVTYMVSVNGGPSTSAHADKNTASGHVEVTAVAKYLDTQSQYTWVHDFPAAPSYDECNPATPAPFVPQAKVSLACTHGIDQVNKYQIIGFTTNVPEGTVVRLYEDSLAGPREVQQGDIVTSLLFEWNYDGSNANPWPISGSNGLEIVCEDSPPVPPAASSESLPKTGSSSDGIVQLAFALCVAGFIALCAAHRRPAKVTA